MTSALDYIILLESSFKVSQKAALQPQLKHVQAGSYTLHQPLPWHGKLQAQSLPLCPPGNLGRCWHGALAGAAFHPTCQCAAPARLTSPGTRVLLLALPSHQPTFLLLLLLHQPPCADSTTLFWSSAFLFSPSPLLSPSAQEIKDNPPFFRCRIPCLTFAVCACTDSKRD